MVRRALPADLDQLTALRSEIFEESADQSRRWFEQIVGLDNVLIAFGRIGRLRFCARFQCAINSKKAFCFTV